MWDYLILNQRYRLLRLIARGGMGEVYAAEDLHRERQMVAVKIVTIDSALPQQQIQKMYEEFQEEAITISSFHHPYILPVHDTGKAIEQGKQIAYMVMPFCHNGTLATWAARHQSKLRTTPFTTAHFISQAAAALQHAHDRKVIHRDVKESNFLLQPKNTGQRSLQGGLDDELPDIFLADFGIAKLSTISSTTSSKVYGSVAYMAPERWEGQSHPANDQYALAIMAFHLLTGRYPFMGNSHALMYQHVHRMPPRPSQFVPTLSQDIDVVILRALEKDPRNRYPTILEFSHALKQAIKRSEASSPDQPTVITREDGQYASPSSARRDLAGGRMRLKSVAIICATLLLLAAIAFPLVRGYFVTPQLIFSAAPSSIPSPHIGPLVLSDQLLNNQQGQNWEEDSDSFGGCAFQEKGYDAIQKQAGYFTTCLARSTSFSDFAYQAQLTIVQGMTGGLLLRAQDAPGRCYAFQISRDGTYMFQMFVNNTRSSIKTLVQGKSTTIKSELGQENTLKVVAQGTTFQLFINGQAVNHVDDSSHQYISGHIGIVADALSNAPTEIIVTALQVWTVS